MRGRQVAAPMLCGAVLCGAMTGGCHRANGGVAGIAVKERLQPQPVRVGPSVVGVELSDTAGKPVSHAAIIVEADMTHPGMSPVFVDAKEIAAGSYSATINLNMGGDWVVLLHIKLADGRKIERQMDVKGVQTN